MAVFYDPPGFTTSRSELFGRRLSSVLNKLSEQKAQRMQKEQGAADTARGLVAMGVPESAASAISMMPERQQEMHLKQFLGSQAFGGGQQDQQQQLMQQLESLGGQQPQQQFQEEPQVSQQDQLLQRLQSPIVTQDTTSLLSQLSPEVRQELQEIAPGTPKKEVVARLRRADTPSTVREAIRRHPLKMKPTNKKTYAQLLATPRPTAADRARLQKLQKEEREMDLAERKFAYKKQLDIDKSTEKTYENILERHKSATENDWRLSKLGALVEKGNLASPLAAALIKTAGIKGFGIDLSALMNADSQEFQKLSTDFIKGAKAIFGARVTEGEIRLFLQTVPTLMQTAEGKRRVIRNMKLFNQADKIRFNIMSQIIDENNGNRPKNLGKLVEQRAKPQLDVIGKKFSELMSGAKRSKKAASGDASSAVKSALGYAGSGLMNLLGKGVDPWADSDDYFR